MGRFVLAVLATWRVTHLLAHEDGPAGLIVRLRVRLGRSFAGQLMDCFYCLSIWIAVPAALFVSRKPVEWLMSWLALSGGVCLLERMVKDPVVIQPIAQPAEEEIDNVLRTEALGVPEQSGAEGGVGSPAGRDAECSAARFDRRALS
jgi:hypothetical protein